MEGQDNSIRQQKVINIKTEMKEMNYIIEEMVVFIENPKEATKKSSRINK